MFWGGAEAFTEEQKQRLLSPRLRRELAGITSWDALAPIRARFDEAAPEPSHVNWMSYLDLRLRLPELLLMRIDKMSMGASLEARVPFLDHRFVALALSIPTRVKKPDGELKHVLREAVRGVIPDELIDRPKQGFRVPVEEWLVRDLGDRTRDEVAKMCASTDLLDGAEAAQAARAAGPQRLVPAEPRALVERDRRRVIRVGYIAGEPNPSRVPHLERIAAHPDLDITVIYAARRSIAASGSWSRREPVFLRGPSLPLTRVLHHDYPLTPQIWGLLRARALRRAGDRRLEPDGAAARSRLGRTRRVPYLISRRTTSASRGRRGCAR